MDETSSAFPDPPYFYTHFTAENLAALADLAPSKDLTPSTSSLPPSSPLHFLVPPPPPSNTYTTFQRLWTFPERHRTLADAEIPILYPPDLDAPSSPSNTSSTISSPQRVIALRRISKSILLAFLELVGIASINPSSADVDDKISDFRNLLFNAHHLINGYRSHHAREQLAELMEEQVKRVEEETAENWRLVGKVNEVLRAVGEVGKKAEEDEKREMENERKEAGGWEKADSVGWSLMEKEIMIV